MKGTGQINGTTTLHAGGTIAFDRDYDRFSFGNLILEGGSNLQFDYGDSIFVNNLTFFDADVNNRINLDLTGFNTYSAPSDTILLTYFQSVTGSTLDANSLFNVTGLEGTGLYAWLSLGNGTLRLNLSTTPVPEPMTTALFLTGAVFGIVCALRRKRGSKIA